MQVSFLASRAGLKPVSRVLANLAGWSRAVAIAVLAAIGLASTAQAAPPTGFSEQTINRPDGGAWNGVVGITFAPDGRGYAWERAGRVWILDSANPVTQPMLDIVPEVGEWADHGMLGFALHPNFAQNGFVYLWYVVDRHHLMNCDSSQPGPPVCNGTYNPATNQYQAATIGRLTRYRAVKPAGAADYSQAVTIDYSSRTVLVGETRQTGCPILYLSHGVGSLVFGEDGTLLASCGDGASYALADPGSDTATYFQQALNDGIIRAKENVGAFRAQLVDSLNGKIIRIDPMTGNGIGSNPFYDTAAPRSARSRVWALGLRNPFRMTRRPDTGEHDPAMAMPGVLYVGDVGWRAWEDLNIVHSGGQNFGWPLYEGMDPHPEYQVFATANQDAPNPWFGRSGCTQQYFQFKELIKQDTLASPLSFPNTCRPAEQIPITIDRFVHARPLIDWKHGENNARWAAFNGNTAESPLVGQSNTEGSWTVQGTPFAGNASTGGTWYTGTAFPAEYRNTYFHADYGAQWIRKFVFNANNFPVSVDVFNPGAGGVVAMAEHPLDGSLYYIAWASFIRKVTYGSGVNRPPVAVASSNVQYGASPLTVSFRGDQSSDPDGTSIDYSWDFGDGSPPSTSANPSHTYEASGAQQFIARLTVTDPGGLSSQATVVISPNNTPPTVSIVSPLDGWMYPMGSAFNLSLSTIVGDAQSPADQLMCQWQIFLHHNYNHTHEDPPISGCDTQTTLTPIGCGDEIYFYEARLTVTDPQGLSRQRSSFIYPDCPGNQAPVANPDSVSMLAGMTKTIDVLANDTDDGTIYVPSLTIVSPPQRGIATFNATTGVVTYAHSGDLSNPADSFSYFVRDTIGKASNTTVVSITASQADGTPPSVPGSLTATARGSSRVDLAWSASTDTGGSGLAGYRVYRNGGATPVATLAASATTYIDYGLAGSTLYSYQVTAFDNANNESALSAAATATTTAAGTWTGINIGSVAIPGSHTQTGNSFTLQASGADVWGTTDQFYFVYQRLTGDGEIRVRVTGVQNTSPWAKAGVMIRDTLAANSRHAMAIVTPERGAVLQYRTSTGGSSGPSGTTGTGTAPEWLRLVRAGSLFTAYKSEDGQAWTQIGQITITMGTSPYVGLMLSSLNNTTLNTATYTGTSIAGPAPVVDTVAPTTPAGLQVTSVGTTTASLSWTASTDTGGSGLAGYRVYRNGSATAVAQVTSGTTFTDTGLTPSTAYSYQVSAYDGSSNESAKSATVNTTTLAAIAAPDVVGQTQADAQSALVSSGLVVGTVGYQYSSTVPATHVISQSPTAGSLVALGSAVNLVVSQGPPPDDAVPPTVPGSLTATARGSSRVDLTWAASSDAGGSGLAGYRVYRNGGAVPVATLTAGATAYNDYGLTGSTQYTYQVTAFDNANNESALSSTATATTGNAGTWTGVNIGAVGIAGNHTQSGNNFTMQASGADVWGTSDQFYFVYQRLTGDGEIRVRVTGLQNTSPWAKAGVMIRDTLATNSKHAMAIVTPERGAVLQYRTATGGSSAPSGTTGTGVAPQWLRLVRAGNVFTAFKSDDGQSWTQLGQITITMGTTPYVGLMLSSLNNTTLNTATYTGANIAGPAPAVDSTAPTIPANLQVTSVGTTTVTLGWSASTDTGGSGLAGYRVYRNGGATPVAQVTTGTTYTDVGLTPNTAYSYQVSSYDGSNNESAKSATVNPTTQTAVAVPDVVGQTQVEAEGMIDSTGLVVGTVSFQYSSTVPATHVISQSPTAGSQVVLGSAVNMIVSQGEPPPDSIEPSVPGALTATARGSSRVDLTWSASTDTGGSGLAGYRVYRNGNGIPLATLTAAATSYTDYGLSGTTAYSYQVSAFDNVGNESALSSIANATTSAQGTWTGLNIGAVAIPGSHSQAGNNFTLQASGADVWGTSDQFYFVHQRLAGDGEIRVKVTGLQNTAPWAKAGVMIRDTLAANSKHAMAIVTPERGAVLQYRTSTGGSSAPSGTTGTGVAPLWLRLVRAGNVFTAFKSDDGQSWTQLGQITITMGTTPYIGLMLSSLNNTTLNTATYEMASTVGVSGGVADTQAPTVPGSVTGSVATLGSLAAPVSTAMRSNPHSVVADDVNGDGKDDLILAVAGDNSVAVLLGQGGGVFAAPAYLPAGTKPKFAVTGDFNRDGKRDIVSADQDSASISVMLGNGNGTFQTRAVYASCDGNHEVAVADLDRDQKEDVVTVCHRVPYTIAVFFGNGDGTFKPRVNLAGAGRTNGVTIRDLNNDLFNDLIVTNNDVALVSVLLGKGDGTFEAPANYATGAGPHSVRVGDVNGDGKLDLVTANDVSASMTVLLGNGNGTFAAGVSYPTSTNSKSIGLGDLDGDGDLDAFVTNTTYPTCCTAAGSVVSYMRNLGNGTFASRVDYPSEANGFGLLIKDLDGDGVIDVTTGNYSTAKYSTMKGRRGPGTLLSWTASSDLGGGSVVGYRVYREGVLIGTTANLNYVDTGLVPGGHYHYTVSAFDNASPANESPQSPEVHILVP